MYAIQSQCTQCDHIQTIYPEESTFWFCEKCNECNYAKEYVDPNVEILQLKLELKNAKMTIADLKADISRLAEDLENGSYSISITSRLRKILEDN